MKSRRVPNRWLAVLTAAALLVGIIGAAAPSLARPPGWGDTTGPGGSSGSSRSTGPGSGGPSVGSTGPGGSSGSSRSTGPGSGGPSVGFWRWRWRALQRFW